MSKAIQSIDTVISSARAARNGSGKCAEQDESGAFSRLLSAGQAEHAAQAEAQAVPENGKTLPNEQREARPEDGAEPNGEAPAGAQETTQAPKEQTDAIMSGEPPADVVSALPVQAIDAAMIGATAPAGPAAEHNLPDGQPTVPDGQPVVPNGQSPVPGEPVAGMPGQVAAPVEAPVNTDVAQAAPAAALSASPAAQVAARQLQGGGEHAEAVRHLPPGEPVGRAVREGVMQMLAARTGQDAGGDAPASGYREPAATFEMPATARSLAASNILSFTDTLLETGSTTPSARVPVTVGQPGWGRAVGEQVVWFVSQNIQSASLKLNPQHLGPLELQLHMDGDKASIAFASQHAAVRDALESSLPRLRDMLAEQGLTLVNVNVSQHDAGSRHERDAGGNRAGASTRTANVDALLPRADGLPGAVAARGLVDCYV